MIVIHSLAGQKCDFLVQCRDFFQGDLNDETYGLLAAELEAPDAPNHIKDPRIQSYTVREGVEAALDPRAYGFFSTVSRSDYPCITVQEASDHFEQCPLDMSKPVKLTKEHCVEMYNDAKRLIQMYSNGVESVSGNFPSSRYPPEDSGLACIWDCGLEASDRKPLHIGLTDKEAVELQDKARLTRDNCYETAKLPNQYYLNPNWAAKVDLEDRDIATEDITNTFTQEVCGEMISESMKGFRDNGKYGSWNLYVALATAITEIDAAVNPGSRDGINKFNTSFFSDVRQIKYNAKYECHRVQVMTSGNEAVDIVRSGLSFNDIQVLKMKLLFYMHSAAKDFNFHCNAR